MSNDLTQIVNFPTWIPDCDAQIPALLDLFISYDANICSRMALPSLENSNHAVVSASFKFLSNSQQDAPFYNIVYDYSCADWDSLCYYMRDVPRENIFKLSASGCC